MKRSPLKRGPGPKRKKGLKPFGKRGKRDRETGRVFGPLCDYVRRMPCLSCRAPAPSDPHHVRSRGSGFGDWIGPNGNVVPLCRECHVRYLRLDIGPEELEAAALDLGERFKEQEGA